MNVKSGNEVYCPRKSSSSEGPETHSHSPTYATSAEAAPEREPQEAEPRREESGRATGERRLR